MKFPMCVACGGLNKLHQHHLVPRTRGGNDDEKNMITLCTSCHGKLHDLTISVSHTKLVSEGIQRAKAAGIRLGPKPIATADAYTCQTPVESLWVALYAKEGMMMPEIVTLRWCDMLLQEVKADFRVFKLSDDTKELIQQSIAYLQLQGEGLLQSIVSTENSPQGLSPNALEKRLGRLRGRTTAYAPYKKPKTINEPRKKVESYRTHLRQSE